MSIKEEQMRWIGSMFSLQGRQRYLCLWVCIYYTISFHLLLLTIYSERKRSQDKIYPKGYAEMLEQQQSQLVSGLKEMYHRLQKVSAWEGPSLDESSGQPLTHDILSALNLLRSKHDDSGEMEVFEENCDKLQSMMVSEGANLVHRRGSISSDSDHSHHDRPKTASSRDETPVQPKMTFFKESFSFHSASSSPLTQSPILRSKPFAQQQLPALSSTFQLPLPELTFIDDPQLYSPEWAQALADTSLSERVYRAKILMHTGGLNTFTPSDPAHLNGAYQLPSFSSQMGNGDMIGGLPDSNDLTQIDTMDFDFSTCVQQPQIIT
jgi:hypothetical protein